MTPGESELEALASAWATSWTSARAAWPGVAVPEDAFAAWVAERLPAELAPIDGLARLRAGALYLACGCLRGQRDALQAFERVYGGELLAAARRGGSRQPDEIVQRLRVRLLVGPGARLRGYAGAGSLKRWLKLACTRLAIDAGRAERSRAARAMEHAPIAEQLARVDPELKLLKGRYRAAFKQAFEGAMQALSPRARTMLRLHLVHGLTIDEIAPMHGVHRATAARWLAKARGEVLEGSRARLGELLATDARDVESILHLIESRLDVSVARHLESSREP